MAADGAEMATPIAATVPISTFFGGSAGLTVLSALAAFPPRWRAWRWRRSRRRRRAWHLLLDHADEFLVGRPEGLADADRVIDDAGDGGVPVAPLRS
jgi:hypothetical protein